MSHKPSLWRGLGTEKGGNAQSEEVKTELFEIYALRRKIRHTYDWRTRRCHINRKMGGMIWGPTKSCTKIET